MLKKNHGKLLLCNALFVALTFALSGFGQGGHDPISICHTTGNGFFELTTIDANSLQGHLGHGDIYPVPANGCPTSGAPTPNPGATPEPLTILLFGVGLTGVGYVTRRRWAKKFGDQQD